MTPCRAVPTASRWCSSYGVGDSWHSFELLLPYLPDTYRVFAVTMRGHGWSDKPETGYSQQDFTTDVHQFLEAQSLNRVTLVGHSWGSFVAQAVAGRGQGRVARLVLIGSGPGGVGDEARRRELRGMSGSLVDPIEETFARDFQASTVHAPIPARFFEAVSDELRRVPRAGVAGSGRGTQQR